MGFTESRGSAKRGNIPKRAVAITFDDGYCDVFDLAYPILNTVRIPATFYAQWFRRGARRILVG